MQTATFIRFSLFCAILFSVSCSSNKTSDDTPIYQSSVANLNTQFNNQLPKTEEKFALFLRDFFIKSAQSGNSTSLEEFIHPDYGIFIVDKPSSFAIINRFTSFEEIINNFPYFANHLQGLSCQTPMASELPKFDCKNFDKQGCFYLKLKDSNTISAKIKKIEFSINETCTKEEKQFAKELDSKIEHIVVMTESFIQLAFAQIDGKWYLVMMDTANYDCVS